MDARLNEAKRELSLLNNFINADIKTNSIVYNKLQETIIQILNEINEKAFECNKNNNNEKSNIDLITIKVQVNQKQLNIDILPTSSINILKNYIEDKIITELGIKLMVERLRVRRTGNVWSSDSKKTLQECNIKHNEEITIDCQSMIDIIDIDDVNAGILSRLNQSNIIPKSNLELLSLVVHSFMLDEGFLPVIELPNNVLGFAPSIKEIQKDHFIPTTWKADVETSGTITIMYKHKSKPGKYFILNANSSKDMINITINERKTNNIFTFEFHLKEYVNTADQTFLKFDRNYKLSSLINKVEELKNNFQIFLYSNQVIPGTIPNKINQMSLEDTDIYTVESPPPQDLFIEQSFQQHKHPLKSPSLNQESNKIHYKDEDSTIYPSRLYNINNLNNPHRSTTTTTTSVGNVDLDPFPERIWIGPQGTSSMPSSLGPLPGTGSYVGPDHPMFDDPNQRSNNIYYQDIDNDYQYPNGNRNIFNTIPPEYLPQARFDPYGPVLGPNSSDIDVGYVGVDSRGRRISPRYPGRRPGRGPPHQGLFPGEPNPDHLKPPGW